ncbi:MAG: hypothetical protein KBT76_14675 [Sulfitobacter litoralis]|nr:hypothetical protein [Sulfitobacter litoralis]
MGIRTIMIIEAAHAAKLSIVAGQMGYPQDFTQGRKLCDFATSATSSTPPTHYFVNDANMATGMESNFRLMAAGEYMPQVVWANVPDITETSANAAAAALSIISEAGGGLGNIDALLEAKGLKFVPSVEI